MYGFNFENNNINNNVNINRNFHIARIVNDFGFSNNNNNNNNFNEAHPFNFNFRNSNLFLNDLTSSLNNALSKSVLDLTIASYAYLQLKILYLVLNVIILENA